MEMEIQFERVNKVDPDTAASEVLAVGDIMVLTKVNGDWEVIVSTPKTTWKGGQLAGLPFTYNGKVYKTSFGESPDKFSGIIQKVAAETDPTDPGHWEADDDGGGTD